MIFRSVLSSGVSSWTSRILRFRRALDELAGGLAGTPRADLAQLAVTCGYYDQPHMYRDFRALAGMTPLEYLAARSDRIHGSDVMAG